MMPTTITKLHISVLLRAYCRIQNASGLLCVLWYSKESRKIIRVILKPTTAATIMTYVAYIWLEYIEIKTVFIGVTEVGNVLLYEIVKLRTGWSVICGIMCTIPTIR